jgi:hypothetical protein
MRKLFSIALFFFAISGIYAQDPEFYFSNNLEDTINAKIDYSQAGTHVLGPLVARKMMLFQATYTYIEKGTLVNPGDKTLIKKPEIYFSVKKLNNFYKKSVKKGVIDKDKAAKDFTSVIDKSYCMMYGNSADFEKYIKSQKKPEDIQKAFDMVKLY